MDKLFINIDILSDNLNCVSDDKIVLTVLSDLLEKYDTFLGFFFISQIKFYGIRNLV